MPRPLPTRSSECLRASRSGIRARGGPSRSCRPFEIEQDFAAEIRGDHLRVLLHYGSRSFSDLLAVVENEDAVAYAHHELHVVLDQEDGRAVAPDVAEERL